MCATEVRYCQTIHMAAWSSMAIPALIGSFIQTNLVNKSSIPGNCRLTAQGRSQESWLDLVSLHPFAFLFVVSQPS